MKDEKELKGTKGSTTNKVRKLQKQYNKILVDLFDQFAAESIEEALDKNEGSFGENIQDIVQCALDCLKGKVMDELGVKDMSGDVAISIGGIGIAGIDEEEPHNEDETPEEHAEHESEETPEEEAAEHAEGEPESEEDDEELKENTLKRDKILSSSRRGDQALLSEAYASMYKEEVSTENDDSIIPRSLQSSSEDSWEGSIDRLVYTVADELMDAKVQPRIMKGMILDTIAKRYGKNISDKAAQWMEARKSEADQPPVIEDEDEDRSEPVSSPEPQVRTRNIADKYGMDGLGH